MTLSRRQILELAAGTVLLPTLSRVARAQAYPTRPVRIISGYPPGIAPDVTARLVAKSLSDRLRQEVVVENRLGGASNIAAEVVVRAVPDGYTLLSMTVTNTVNATLYPNLGFDIVRDIVPIAATFRSPNVLVVNPSFPAKTLTQLIEYAKAHPGEQAVASARRPRRARRHPRVDRVDDIAECRIKTIAWMWERNLDLLHDAPRIGCEDQYPVAHQHGLFDVVRD